MRIDLSCFAAAKLEDDELLQSLRVVTRCLRDDVRDPFCLRYNPVGLRPR